jgi:hypothetical protein
VKAARKIDGGDLKLLERLLQRTGGEAWEPPDPRADRFDTLIAGGYLVRCDMRCGFEAFRDSGVRWTDAGRRAIEARVALRRADEIDSALRALVDDVTDALERNPRILAATRITLEERIEAAIAAVNLPETAAAAAAAEAAAAPPPKAKEPING